MLDSYEFLFTDFVVRDYSRALEQPTDKKTVKHILGWVHDTITYRRDVDFYGENYVQPPAVTVKYNQGNCLDMVALVASFLNKLNIPFRIVLGKDRKEPSELHVWIESKGPKWKIVGDPTNGIIDLTEDFDEYYLENKPSWDILDKTEWI